MWQGTEAAYLQPGVARLPPAKEEDVSPIPATGISPQAQAAQL